MQRWLYIDEAHTELDIFRFAVFFDIAIKIRDILNRLILLQSTYFRSFITSLWENEAQKTLEPFLKHFTKVRKLCQMILSVEKGVISVK